MNIPFEINGKYTLLAISGMAITIRNEIIITNPMASDHENRPRYTYKNRGKKKEFLLPTGNDLQKYLVFKGHDLPFIVDSETNRFWGNAKFNFVTDKPKELKLFLEKNCFNPSVFNFQKCFYTGVDRDSVEIPESLPLFPGNNE